MDDGSMLGRAPSFLIVFTTICSQSQQIFNKVAARKIRHFALDLSFVSLGIRTGYLFDAFAVSGRRPAVFTDLLVSLRQAVPAFEDVIILHEPISDQLFFVNFALLEERCVQQPGYGIGHDLERQGNAEQWPNFVQLFQVPTLVRIPTQVDSLLRELRARGEKRAGLQRPVVLAITQPLVITDSVPLAAVLLEYPVAYVPADADQTEFLPGVLLDVYHCVISLADTTLDDTRGAPGDAREHTLLKFSCPACLAEQDTSLSPARMMDRLRVSFGARLNAAEGQWSLAVRHTTEAHDRVSL